MSSVLHAVCFGASGAGRAVEVSDLASGVSPCGGSSPYWLHLNGADAEGARTVLEHPSLGLDSVIIDALLAEETRPRMAPIGDGVLLILRGVNLNEGAAPEDMVSIRLWVNGTQVVSVQRRQLKAVSDVFSQLMGGEGLSSTGDLICALTNRLFERMAPILADLQDSVDVLEDALLDGGHNLAGEAVSAARRKATIFKRYLAPQQDALASLKQQNAPWLEEAHKVFLQEQVDGLSRYVEDLDALRERAQIVKDELANSIATKLNENMYVLSVIAAIFLPLGFLTGLLGVNVAGIPGAEAPYAFEVFCGLLVLLVIAQVVVFKKKGWF